MTLPTFVGIGAQRAATTWVYECLKEHPEVFMTKEKEVCYFSKHYDKGRAWYESHFKNVGICKAIGEFTPNYLNNELAIPRMAKDIPHAKLFVILREPVSRAYSAYKLLHEHYKGMTFREACEASDYLLRLSFYAEDLQKVFSYYDRKNVAIFLYDDVRRRPNEMLRELFDFIGVNSDYEAAAANRVFNSIIMPNVQRCMGSFGLKPAADAFKQTVVGVWLKGMLMKMQVRPRSSAKMKSFSDPIGSEYRDFLKVIFREDILKTQDLIKRDLSAWL